MSIEPEIAKRVTRALNEGRLLAIPTETVYGLAAPIDRPDLIARIFELKGRPAENPLIVHVATLEQAQGCVERWSELADTLAARFWPGPLTLVLPRSTVISDRISGGQPTVALRMPDHPLTLGVIRALDRPVVAPSANLYTRLSPTSADAVASVFSADDVMVLDGGPCRVGIESTIVAIDEPNRILWWLRPGQVHRQQLIDVLPPGWSLQRPDEDAGQAEPVVPGKALAHYRPGKRLRVHVCSDTAAAQGMRLRLERDSETTCLELPIDPDQAARSLYAMLRDADQRPGQRIDLVISLERVEAPAWEGVINRLQKAASEWIVVGD